MKKLIALGLLSAAFVGCASSEPVKTEDELRAEIKEDLLREQKRNEWSKNYVEERIYGESSTKPKALHELNQTQSQNGFDITLESITSTSTGTKVKAKVVNNSDQEVTLYIYNSKITQGSTQYVGQYNSKDGIDTEILPGIEVSGTILFDEKVDLSKPMQFVVDAPFGENYRTNFEKYIFDIDLTKEDENEESPKETSPE